MAPRVKRTPQEKLKGARLAIFQELETRIAGPNPNGVAGQLRLLDVGIAEYATKIPEVVAWMLEEADPIDVASATARAKPTGKSWQDMKATLELTVRLIRARALWEAQKIEDANAELKQISASASSRRIELILEAAARTDASGAVRPEWSAGFSLALLRSSSGAMASSIPAALSLIDAMIGSGEAQAAAMILGQLVAGWSGWPTVTRESLADRIGRLDPELGAPIAALLAGMTTPVA